MSPFLARILGLVLGLALNYSCWVGFVAELATCSAQLQVANLLASDLGSQLCAGGGLLHGGPGSASAHRRRGGPWGLQGATRGFARNGFGVRPRSSARRTSLAVGFRCSP